jgi:hypothetical protein
MVRQEWFGTAVFGVVRSGWAWQAIKNKGGSYIGSIQMEIGILCARFRTGGRGDV